MSERNYELAAKLSRTGDDVLIGPAEVAALSGLSAVTIGKRKVASMPAPMPGLSVLRWRLGDIRGWIRGEGPRGLRLRPDAPRGGLPRLKEKANPKLSLQAIGGSSMTRCPRAPRARIEPHGDPQGRAATRSEAKGRSGCAHAHQLGCVPSRGTLRRHSLDGIANALLELWRLFAWVRGEPVGGCGTPVEEPALSTPSRGGQRSHPRAGADAPLAFTSRRSADSTRRHRNPLRWTPYERFPSHRNLMSVPCPTLMSDKGGLADFGCQFRHAQTWRIGT